MLLVPLSHRSDRSPSSTLLLLTPLLGIIMIRHFYKIEPTNARTFGCYSHVHCRVIRYVRPQSFQAKIDIFTASSYVIIFLFLLLYSIQKPFILWYAHNRYFFSRLKSKLNWWSKNAILMNTKWFFFFVCICVVSKQKRCSREPNCIYRAAKH